MTSIRFCPNATRRRFAGPTQADHSPAMQDAFNLSDQVGQMPLHAGGVIPGDDLLPDDWDKDLLEGIAPAGAPAAARQPQRRRRSLGLRRPHAHRSPGRCSTAAKPSRRRRQ